MPIYTPLLRSTSPNILSCSIDFTASYSSLVAFLSQLSQSLADANRISYRRIYISIGPQDMHDKSLVINVFDPHFLYSLRPTDFPTRFTLASESYPEEQRPWSPEQ
jgi:hypothetical protein